MWLTKVEIVTVCQFAVMFTAIQIGQLKIWRHGKTFIAQFALILKNAVSVMLMVWLEQVTIQQIQFTQARFRTVYYATRKSLKLLIIHRHSS